MQYEFESTITGLQNFELNMCYTEYLPFWFMLSPSPQNTKKKNKNKL